MSMSLTKKKMRSSVVTLARNLKFWSYDAVVWLHAQIQSRGFDRTRFDQRALSRTKYVNSLLTQEVALT